jgi:ATP-dependent DNA helicase RecG
VSAKALMELHMTSLLPPAAVAEVEAHFGTRFAALPELERLALVLTAADGVLNHTRLREVSSDHPADITKRLARLVRDGLLVSDGVGRGTVYFLPWQVRTGFQPELAALGEGATGLPPELGALPPELIPQAPELTPELAPQAPDMERVGGDTPVALAVGAFSPEELAQLQRLALPVSTRKRAPPEVVREVVLQLCERRFIGLRALATLLGRRDTDGSDLRKRILNPLVQEGRLLRAYPRPNDPRQAYITAPKTE